MRSVLAVAGAAVAVTTVGFSGSGALARTDASTPRSIAGLQVAITPLAGGRSRFVSTGAIGDYGTAVTVDSQGKPSRTGHDLLAHLTHGTLLLDGTSFDAKVRRARPDVSLPNCSSYVAVTGAVTIVKGGGTYIGAHGTLTMTGVVADIAPRSASGRCEFSARPKASYAAITGTGNVSFSTR